ncbi:hypothetical protein KC357_g43 [Hortaea werneckii]|nr:hypothetical protein KC357_g43 [Hortaea werneckii]
MSTQHWAVRRRRGRASRSEQAFARASRSRSARCGRWQPCLGLPPPVRDRGQVYSTGAVAIRDDVLNAPTVLQLYQYRGRIITARKVEGRVISLLTINTSQLIALLCSFHDSHPRRDKCSVSDQHSQGPTLHARPECRLQTQGICFFFTTRASGQAQNCIETKDNEENSCTHKPKEAKASVSQLRAVACERPEQLYSLPHWKGFVTGTADLVLVVNVKCGGGPAGRRSACAAQ